MARSRPVPGNNHQEPSLKTNVDVETHFQLHQQNDACKKKVQEIKSHRKRHRLLRKQWILDFLTSVTALKAPPYIFCLKYLLGG